MPSMPPCFPQGQTSIRRTHSWVFIHSYTHTGISITAQLSKNNQRGLCFFKWYNGVWHIIYSFIYLLYSVNITAKSLVKAHTLTGCPVVSEENAERVMLDPTSRDNLKFKDLLKVERDHALNQNVRDKVQTAARAI